MNKKQKEYNRRRRESVAIFSFYSGAFFIVMLYAIMANMATLSACAAAALVVAVLVGLAVVYRD